MASPERNPAMFSHSHFTMTASSLLFAHAASRHPFVQESSVHWIDASGDMRVSPSIRSVCGAVARRLRLLCVARFAPRDATQ